VHVWQRTLRLELDEHHHVDHQHGRG
jgi:hypothetical protein